MFKSLISSLFSNQNKQRNIWLNRNDLCWCGSGKKYKRCHMAQDEPLRRKAKNLTCSLKG